MSKSYPGEPAPFKVMIGFYELVNTGAKLAYKFVRSHKDKTTHEQAQENMREFLDTGLGFEYDPGEEAKPSLENALNSFGKYPVSYDKICETSEKVLWDCALKYDLKGIIPASHENLTDFVYRANSLLYVHRSLKKRKLQPKVAIDAKLNSISLKIDRNANAQLIRQKDLEEANKRIPYFMDLTWVAAYVNKQKDFIVPAAGLTFTLPQHNGMNFIQMLDNYKDKQFFLNVLSHEMVHAGTVYLDVLQKPLKNGEMFFDVDKEYTETKAYHVGAGSKLLGEQIVAFNTRPGLLTKVIQFGLEAFLHISIPNRFLQIIPKLKSSVNIWEKTKTFKSVKKKLNTLFGEKGNYILGRLTAEEINEFDVTNNIIKRIEMKDNLKWGIMMENLYNI